MVTIKKEIKNEFLYNSNLIEGINYPFINYNKANTKILEIKGHSNAFEYMIKNCSENLIESKILKMHKLLTEGLLELKYSGKYRDCNVFIGGGMGSYPSQIKKEMKDLIKMTKLVKTLQDCWDCHHEFEKIHPFVDGNGRIGRLILNWLCLKNHFPFQIIKIENRAAYYHEIRVYKLNKTFLRNDFWGKN